MALEAFKGKMVFLGGAGVFVEFFLHAWRLWHERAGAPTKFGDSPGILVDFWRV
jgi:hypothetical protein